MLMASPASASPALPPSLPPSLTSIPGVSVDSAGTFHYRDPLISSKFLVSTTSRIEIGHRNAQGGCALSGSNPVATAAFGSGFYSAETSYNPTTCRATFVSGRLTAAGKATLATTRSSSSVAAPGTRSTFGSPMAAPSNGYWSAFNKVSWVDPIDLTIVSLADNLTWQTSGWSIPWASAYPVPYMEHIGGDVTTNLGGGTWWSSGSNYTENTAYNYWTNSDFEAWVVAVIGPAGYAACGFNSTPANFYLQSSTIGYNNAYFGVGWNSWNSGGCVDLTWLRQNSGPGSGS